MCKMNVNLIHLFFVKNTYRKGLFIMNKKSRSSVEMSDKKYRPEIMEKEIDMSSYNEIFLGFPIWWYVAPTIINTFFGNL